MRMGSNSFYSMRVRDWESKREGERGCCGFIKV